VAAGSTQRSPCHQSDTHRRDPLQARGHRRTTTPTCYKGCLQGFRLRHAGAAALRASLPLSAALCGACRASVSEPALYRAAVEWHVRGTRLPERVPAEFRTNAGRISVWPVPGAKELAADGFVLPGLVDVHTNPSAPVAPDNAIGDYQGAAGYCPAEPSVAAAYPYVTQGDALVADGGHL